MYVIVIFKFPSQGIKDPSDSDSYLSIALVPTLHKVFKWCILIECRFVFVLQFDFKKEFSMDLCTGLIKNFSDTEEFDCFLDSSKAFD